MGFFELVGGGGGEDDEDKGGGGGWISFLPFSSAVPSSSFWQGQSLSHASFLLSRDRKKVSRKEAPRADKDDKFPNLVSAAWAKRGRGGLK